MSNRTGSCGIQNQ